LVLTPGLYGVQINGTYPDLQANGNITANGSVTGNIIATNNVVSSSTQVQNYDVFALNSNLYTSTGSLIGITNGLMALTASMKAVAIVSSSQQIQNYNLFAVTSSANTFYGDQTISGSLRVNNGITGSLNGNATTATTANLATNAGNVAVVRDNTDTTLYPVFTGTVAADAYYSLKGHTSGTLYYNGVTRRLHMEGLVVSGSNVEVTGSLNVTGSGTFTDTLTIQKPAAISSLIVKNNSSTTGLWLYLNGLDATLSNQDNGKLSLQSNGTTAVEINQLAASNFIGAVTASQTLTATKAAIGSTVTPTIPLEVYGQQKWFTTTGDGSELRGLFNPGGAADDAQLTLYKADGTTAGVKITPDGIDFSANSNVAGMTSELLNDYEEGTWTPVIRGAGTAGTYELTSTSHYTKIGRQVTLITTIALAGSITGGGSGYLQISGVPFAKAASTFAIGTVSTNGVDTVGNYLTVQFISMGAETTLFLSEVNDNAAPSDLPISAISATDGIALSITYFV
jgi:hypothetical protein